MTTQNGPAIRLVMGGIGSITPHPDDNSETAEAIRATLEQPERTPPTDTPKEAE